MPPQDQNYIEYLLRLRSARRPRPSKGSGFYALRVAAVLLVAGATALVWRWPELSDVFGWDRRTRVELATPVPPAPPHPAPDHSARPAYAYSVVPGGVENADDAWRAAAADPVVRAHYRDLNLARLKLVRLSADRTAFVSYRKGSEVFWTTRKVRLPKGEAMLSDGENMVRARCGNRVSEAAMSKTAPQEPPATDLDTPILPGGPMAPLALPEPAEQTRLLVSALPPQFPEPPPPLPENPEEILTSAPKDGTFAPQQASSTPLYSAGPLIPFFYGGVWGPMAPIGPANPINTTSNDTGDNGKNGGKNSNDNPPAETPEPSTWLLAGAGLLATGGVLARVRRNGKP